MHPRHSAMEAFCIGTEVVGLHSHPGMDFDDLEDAFDAACGCSSEVVAGMWNRIDFQVTESEQDPPLVRHLFWTLCAIETGSEPTTDLPFVFRTNKSPHACARWVCLFILAVQNATRGVHTGLVEF